MYAKSWWITLEQKVNGSTSTQCSITSIESFESTRCSSKVSVKLVNREINSTKINSKEKLLVMQIINFNVIFKIDTKFLLNDCTHSDTLLLQAYSVGYCVCIHSQNTELVALDLIP
jgi:hypothetical protein